MSPTLERMKQILPLLEAAPPTASGEFVRYEVEIGYCVGLRLFNTAGVAVQNIAMAKGTIFPVHFHEEKEVFIVHNGNLLVIVDGERVAMGQGDMLEIPPKAAHSASATTDCEFIATTVPPASGYPGVF